MLNLGESRAHNLLVVYFWRTQGRRRKCSRAGDLSINKIVHEERSEDVVTTVMARETCLIPFTNREYINYIYTGITRVECVLHV